MLSYRRQAKLFKLLSHPTRLRILNELRQDEECVCHLQTVLGKSQPYISQQLAVLRGAGVVQSRKEGLNVFYRLKNGQVVDLLQAVLDENQAEGGEQETAAAHRAVEGCPCPKCHPG